MIQPIDEIPGSNAKSRSRREFVRADIQEALDKDIRRFEFVGDEYNYKTLAQLAGETARNIWNRFFRECVKQINPREIGVEHIWANSWDITYRDLNPIHIYSTAKEGVAKTERRVFCEIDRPLDEILAQEVIERIIKEEKARQERIDRDKAMRKGTGA